MGTPLSESLASGDREAFAALYDRLGPRLFRTARMMLSSTAEAEDVVHDLFVELARLRHRLARAVAALPAAQREVLALKIDGGLTFAEIAGVSDAPLGPLVAERQRANPALRSSQAHGPLAHPGMLRVLDAHHLLEETL